MKKSVKDYINRYCLECCNYYGEDGYGENYCYGTHSCSYITPGQKGGELRQEVIDICKEEDGFCQKEF